MTATRTITIASDAERARGAQLPPRPGGDPMTATIPPETATERTLPPGKEHSMASYSVTASKATTYTATFDRIGRRHDVEPLTFTAADADSAAEQVFKYARRFLHSRDVLVTVDFEEMRGYIECGVRNGGTFTLAVSA